jgi:HK97 gp10 family phage protein
MAKRVVTAKLTGERELAQAFKKLKRVAQEEALEQAAMAGGYVVERAAKINAPVDTGNLRNSIIAFVIVRSRTRVEVGVGTNVEYAEVVEVGSMHQQAQPYLRPAFDENEERIRAAVTRMLRKRIMDAYGI